MNKLLLAIVALLLLYVILKPSANYSISYDEAVKNAKIQDLRYEKSLSPRVHITNLYDDYMANEVSADNKYANKVIDFYGTIASIDKDIDNQPHLLFDTGRGFNHVIAKMKEVDNDAIASLKIGDMTMVRCNNIKRIVYSPTGDNCVLIDNDGMPITK